MKLLLVSFILTINIGAHAAPGTGFSNASTGMKDEYTGQEPLKASTEMPEELDGVKIQEKIGQHIDLTQMVTTEKGELVPLSSFFTEHKPVILSPVYFNCPGLCNYHLNGLTDVLKQVDWSPGMQFQMVAFSFDAREHAPDAEKKKEMYMKVYNRPGTESGWHFVTATEPVIKNLMEQVGFSYRWNEKVGEWSHASAAIVIAPDGTISRYLHGIGFESRDVKLALNEAANGKVGNIVDSVMLYCFKYDRHQSKYGLQVYRVMQLAGGLTVAMFALWLIPVILRAKRENA